MATTSRPISELVVGIRDTSGAVVASGKARFYQPGTLVAQSVFSDDACSSAITQPQTLNAAGQATVYTLEPVRMIVKDSTETTTYYDGIVNLNRADAVYLTVSGISGGNETTLETVLQNVSSSFGSGFQYLANSTATAMNVKDALNQNRVNVKAFGATGDGSTNDYAAVQACIDFVESLGGGIVYFPYGTYLLNTGLTIDVAGVSIEGAGKSAAVLKNGSSSNTLITFNPGAAGDSKAHIRDIGITASTTSSGTAILVTNGDRIEISNVQVALHRTSIDCNAVTAARVEHCYVVSTDDNASSIGVRVGTRGSVERCEVASGTTNGTGIILNGSFARADLCYVANWATGISMTGADSVVPIAFISGSTTGVSVGAVASVTVGDVHYSGCTTDISVNSSATLLRDIGRHSSASNSGATPFPIHMRFKAPTFTSVTTNNPTLSPTHTTEIVQTWQLDSGAAGTPSVAAPSGSNKQVGDVIWISIRNTSASAGTLAPSYNSIYKMPDGSTNVGTTYSLTTTQHSTLGFRWNGTNYVLIFQIYGISA